jgi:hypothetical protein
MRPKVAVAPSIVSVNAANPPLQVLGFLRKRQHQAPVFRPDPMREVSGVSRWTKTQITSDVLLNVFPLRSDLH